MPGDLARMLLGCGGESGYVLLEGVGLLGVRMSVEKSIELTQKRQDARESQAGGTARVV